MNAWPRVTLADVCHKPQYGAIAKGSSAPIGPLFVRQTDIAAGRIDWTSVPFCDLSANEFEKYAIRRGDLLISRLGNGVGNAATVRETNSAVFAGYLVCFRAKASIADSEFLGYHLQSEAWKKHVSGFRSGAAQPTLNAQQMGAFPFLLPPLLLQRSIAATLSSLDDKIESNRRAIQLMLQLVRAKVNAALHQAVQPVSVATLARFVNGGAYTKGATGKGRMVIRIADLNSGPGPSTVYNELEVPDDKTARPGDILMSWSGSLGVYRWFREEAIVNQHIFKILPDGYPDWLVFDRLEHVLEIFRGIAKDKATTMGHIKRGHLESTTVDIPTASFIDSLDHELSPLWNRLLVAEQECLRLERLRDSLLPEILSGRLRVPEAEMVMA